MDALDLENMDRDDDDDDNDDDEDFNPDEDVVIVDTDDFVVRALGVCWVCVGTWSLVSSWCTYIPRSDNNNNNPWYGATDPKR